MQALCRVIPIIRRIAVQAFKVSATGVQVLSGRQPVIDVRAVGLIRRQTKWRRDSRSSVTVFFRRHLLRCVAAFPLHPQPSRWGGAPRSTGIEVSYEIIRHWAVKFRPQIAEKLKASRPVPSPRWPRRDGLPGRRQADVPLASRR
jgi:hypothetical protein